MAEHFGQWYLLFIPYTITFSNFLFPKQRSPNLYTLQSTLWNTVTDFEGFTLAKQTKKYNQKILSVNSFYIIWTYFCPHIIGTKTAFLYFKPGTSEFYLAESLRFEHEKLSVECPMDSFTAQMLQGFEE